MVVGLGNIGSEYARRMKAMGSYIIAVDCNAYKKPDFVDEFFLSDRLDEVLPRADVVALIVPGTKANAGLMGRSQLAKMKQGAVIINAGRGTLVDTDALCDALESGALSAAGLEVTEPEPLPEGHRLWKLENALITPHVAGGRHLAETYKNILRHWLDNASRFVKGEALKSVVDYKTGFCVPEGK
jgi:phosphoglycerate dehydrogenase-like enzyme